MSARTWWSAKADPKPAEKRGSGPAASPDLPIDDLLDARFDEEGRLSQLGQRQPPAHCRAARSAPGARRRGARSRRAEARGGAGGDRAAEPRARRPPSDPSATRCRRTGRGAGGRDFVTYSLDRLEARLEALSKRLQQRAGAAAAPCAAADGAAPQPIPAMADDHSLRRAQRSGRSRREATRHLLSSAGGRPARRSAPRRAARWREMRAARAPARPKQAADGNAPPRCGGRWRRRRQAEAEARRRPRPRREAEAAARRARRQAEEAEARRRAEARSRRDARAERRGGRSAAPRRGRGAPAGRDRRARSERQFDASSKRASRRCRTASTKTRSSRCATSCSSSCSRSRSSSRGGRAIAGALDQIGMRASTRWK